MATTVALLLAGCGSAGQGAALTRPSGGNGTVWRAIDADTTAGTAHVQTTVEMQAADPGEGSVSSTMHDDGVLDFGQRRVEETETEEQGGSVLSSVLSSCPGTSGGPSASGSADQTQMVINQQTAYLPAPPGCRLPAGKASVMVSLAALTPTATALAYLDPVLATEALTAIRGKVTRLESTSVGGVTARRYTGTMPAAALLSAIGFDGQQLIDTSGKAVSGATVQLWIDGRGRLVQWLVQGYVSISRFLSAESGSGSQGTVPRDIRPVIAFTIRCTLSNLGSAVQIPQLDPSQAVASGA